MQGDAIGNKNVRSDNFIDDLSTEQRINLEALECERVLGVFVSSDLKWSKHALNKASKVSKVLGMIVKNFTSRDVGSSCTLVLLGIISNLHLPFGICIFKEIIVF